MQNSEIEFRVTGRVQYVMFRDFVRRKAVKFKINGFVKNNNDGSVTVVAQGEKESLRKLEKKLWQGSVLSKVLNVSKVERAPKEIYSDFLIRYE